MFSLDIHSLYLRVSAWAAVCSTLGGMNSLENETPVSTPEAEHLSHYPELPSRLPDPARHDSQQRNYS